MILACGTLDPFSILGPLFSLAALILGFASAGCVIGNARGPARVFGALSLFCGLFILPAVPDMFINESIGLSFLLGIGPILGLCTTAVSVFGMHRAAKFPIGHCQTCGYNLTGNVSGKCTECGTVIAPLDAKLFEKAARPAQEPAQLVLGYFLGLVGTIFAAIWFLDNDDPLTCLGIFILYAAIFCAFAAWWIKTHKPKFARPAKQN